MRVRCGRCQTDFEISGPGRFQCPACGALNEVRAAAGAPSPPPSPPPGFSDPGSQMPPGMGAPAPPPPPEPPSPKTTCPACEFSFIVGDIEVAVCPMCGEEVTVKPNS